MSFSNIKLDCKRLRERVEHNIKQNVDLHLLSARYKLHYQDGEQFVTLRVPHQTIPRFEKNPFPPVEVWTGEGNVGDHLGYADADFWGGDIDDPFKRKWHKKKWNPQRLIKGQLLEMEVSLEFQKLVDFVVEEIQLLPVFPRGNKTSYSEKDTSYSAQQSRSNLNHRRSLRQALKRNAALGTYQPGDAIIIEERDLWSNSIKRKPSTDCNAVIIYLLGNAPKYIAATEVFWLNHLLERQYQDALTNDFRGIKKRYLRYSTFSAEVSLEDFVKMDFKGSQAEHVGYSKALEVIHQEQAQGMKNIYLFHYSRGNIDNDEKSLIVPRIQEIIRSVNVFGYTQIGNKDKTLSVGEDGGLKRFLENHFVDDVGMGNLLVSYIRNEKRDNLGSEILDSLRNKLITGR
ncbi:MAG: DUF444 family protein [Nanoarchaeota archaeon]|nr:DUF444 family protein [Nanoarchaeota archaeon]